MNDLILQGTIKAISPVTQGTSANGNTWKKCEVVVKDESTQYGNGIVATAFNDKVDLLGNFKVGDQVVLHFNAKYRTYNEKVYNDISVWKIEAVGAQQPTASVSPAPQPAVVTTASNDDGLPF